MKKQLYALFFILFMVNTIQVHSQDNALESIEKQPINKFNIIFNELNLFSTTNEELKWAFMEKKFITDMYTSKEMTWSQITAAIPAALVALAGYDYATNSIMEHATKKNIILLGGSAVTMAMISAQYLDYYLNQQSYRTAITNFFTHWEIYKFYVPERLIEYFTLIADTIEINGLQAVLPNAQTIVKEIQDTVTRYFESRYKKLLELEAAHNLSDTKTFSEIFKNLVGGAKDLAM